MPMYEFRCQECRSEFTKIMRMQDDRDELSCPNCDSPRIKRLFSVVSVKTSKKS